MARLFGSPESATNAPPLVTDVEELPAPDAEQLYRQHSLHLTRLAAMVVGDRAAAEDVVHDAFATMHHRWGRLRDPNRALAYLRTSVLNGARMALRRRRIAAEHPPDPPGEQSPAKDRSRTPARWFTMRRRTTAPSSRGDR